MARALEDLRQANLSVRLAHSAFTPKVNSDIFGAFGGSNISNQTYGLTMNQRFWTGTQLRTNVAAASLQNQLGNFYNSDTTFEISQSLLRGFGRDVGRQPLFSAELQAASSARLQTMTERQVGVEVAGAYYRIVSQGQLLEDAGHARERSQLLLDASRAKLQVGMVSQLDVLRAEQLAAEADVRVLDAATGVEDAKDQLRMLLRRGVDYDFTVAQDIPVDTQTLSPEEATRIALGNRPELDTARDAVRQAEGAALVAQNQLKPQLDLSLAVTRRETAESLGASFGLDNFELTSFAGISLPFDRTPQSVGHETALISLEQRRRDLEQVELRVAQEARQAVRRQAQLLRSLELASASVDFAQREVELATLRYQRGLSNNLDVVNAEANVVAARSRRVGLLANLATARLQLRATLGILDPLNDIR